MAPKARPAPWPPKPDLYDEVSWGALPTLDDYKLAYKVWSLPNANLAPKSVTPVDDPPSVLVRNVYDHIVASQSTEMLGDQTIDENAQMTDLGDHVLCGWTYDDIFPRLPGEQAAVRKEDVAIDGRGWKVYWTKATLTAALTKRSLSTEGKVVDLKTRLFEYEASKQASRQGKSITLLPRANLRQWGMERKERFLLVVEPGRDEQQPLDMYTWAILLSPYNPTYWTSRAYLFYQMGHFDLALGDAYRAFYLVEILQNNHIRTQQPGLYPRIWDAIEQHIKVTGAASDVEPVATMRKANGVNAFVPALRRTFHHIISLSLFALEAWEDLEEMDNHLTQRMILAGPHKIEFTDRAEIIQEFAALKNKEDGDDQFTWYHEKRAGSIVPRPYPQTTRGVNRINDAFLAKLNGGFIDQWPGAQLNRPGLQVRRKGDGSLGVFASGDIAAKLLIYAEEPSVRGHLARSPPSGELRCENCKRRASSAKDAKKAASDWTALKEEAKRENQHRACCACTRSDVPLYFCRTPLNQAVPAAGSSNIPGSSEDTETCLEISRATFHNRACGRDWRWLHDAMQPVVDDGARNPSVNHERHGTILSLLLREVFDMTLIARREGTVANVLAHEIDPMLPLCGGEDMPSKPTRRFPFGYAANIVVPFDILLKLGVNIFRDLEFDTWVIQLVLRKLLLNVVPWDESRRGPVDEINFDENDEKRPHANIEDLYVHTGFSMFNHACDGAANARWFWDSDTPGIPNRIIVKTTKAVADGEEIRLLYFPEAEATRRKQRKLLGGRCNCTKCRAQEKP